MQAFTSRVKVLAPSILATPAGWLARVAFCFGVALTATATATAGEWAVLANDGVHDPKSPAVKILQEPGQALSKLTPDTAGNQVRWVQALDKKEIQPRERYFPKTEIRKLDKDIILDPEGSMPSVRFPHRQHTEWLDCVNCHNGLFATRAGGTKISMFNILQGEQCGLCHGAVSFPLTECSRCHSIPHSGQVKSGKPVGTNPHGQQPAKEVP